MAFIGSPGETKLKAANSRSKLLLSRIGATAAQKRGRKIKGPYRGKNLQKEQDRTAGF